MDGVGISPAGSIRVIGWVLIAALCVVLSACSSPPAPQPPAPQSPAPQPPAATGLLAGWKLTLPLAGKKKDSAQIVDPAQVSPPFLTSDTSGTITLWAPVNGATTAHSDHARTELDRLDNFQAGASKQTLSASVAVAQVPTENQDVIIGQIHGADDISSVPFVMLHYVAGAITVVVKQKQSGDELSNYTLVTGVPLDARFDFSIRDNGNGALTFTADYGDQHASIDAPVPDAFRDATVRFQAGAYQLADSTSGPAADTDGARVTFSALTAGPPAG
jgi:Alginate lyase